MKVKVSPSGRIYFANEKGEEVRVYLSVHPEHFPDGAVIQEQQDREREEAMAKYAGWSGSIWATEYIGD